MRLKLAAELRIFLQLQRAVGAKLGVLQHQMPDFHFIGFARLGAAAILRNAADGDDTGEAGRDLVERQPMGMRVKPEQSLGMIDEVDIVVDHPVGRDVELAGMIAAMVHRRTRRISPVRKLARRIIGRIDAEHEDVVAVAVARIVGSTWLDDEPMGVQVGWIVMQQGLAVLADVLELALRHVLHDRREAIDEANLEPLRSCKL
nr:hypothetical protein [Bradyrhizobium sp. SZCCHNR1091]